MDEQTQNKPKSYVVATFSDIGSVVVNVVMEGVTPLQVIALAQYLEVKGKNELIRTENERLEQEAMRNISRPKPEILRPS